MQPLFDQSLIYRQLRNARRDFSKIPFLEDIAGDIFLRLAPVRRDFETALNLFPPAPEISDALIMSGKIGHVEEKPFNDTREDLQLGSAQYDLVFSCLGLQFANDLPGVLAQIQRALKPGGFFLACMAGGDSLKELREAFTQAETETSGGLSPRIHPTVDVKQMGGLLQRAQFIEPITDVEKYVFSYGAPLDLLKDLVQWSPGNLLLQRSRKFLKRETLRRMDDIYRARFSTEQKKIRATFELLWLSAWRAEARPTASA